MSIRRVAARLLMSAIMAAVVVSVAGTTQAMAAPGGERGTAADAAPEVGAVGPLGPLTDLVIQRLRISDQVAAAKFGTGQPISDPAREQQELAAVRQSAVSLGIDPDATVSFFQQQITASKVVQQGLFDRWTAHPDEAPTTRPDLTVIRGELDQLTTELLQQLVAEQHVLAGGVECRVDLDLAAASGAVVNHLDGLHRHALRVALASTCVSN